jgi:hypothetical protein
VPLRPRRSVWLAPQATVFSQQPTAEPAGSCVTDPKGVSVDDSHRTVQLVLLAAAAAIAVVAVSQLRVKRRTVEATAQGIHDQLDALDPVSRAAVIARLTAGAVKDVRGRVGRS